MRTVLLSLLCFLASAFWLALSSGCDPRVDLGSVDLAVPGSDGGTMPDLLFPPVDLAGGGGDLAVLVPSFAPVTTINVGATVVSMVSGDFDGDKRADLVVSG